MCILIDVNVISAVFNEEDSRHRDFFPVKGYIESGGGFFVYGGTKYKKELAASGIRVMRLVRDMRNTGKVVTIDDAVVDALEADVIVKTSGTQCDDQHIIAIIGASSCPLLCSGDYRSFQYIKDRDLYPRGVKRVKIYTTLAHKRLLLRMKKSVLRNVSS
jgi:hypothetical protein